MGKMQRVYKTGTDFWVEGASERGRWLRFRRPRKDQRSRAPNLPAGQESGEAQA